MAWDTVPAPNYAAFDSGAVGNALSNLVGNYQASQQGEQRTRANDLRNQQDQMLLSQQRAFAGGVPMTPAGTPDWSKIGTMEAEKGNVNALSALAPLIQQEQWEQNRAPSSAWGGSSSAAPAGGEGGTAKGTYSLSQMIQMAENAGFKGEDAAHIAAIAMAESAGKPDATGPAGEIGLTQINPHAWGFADSARDPQQAFSDAYQVFKKQGWGAWSTDPTSKNFTPGNSMDRFLPRAEADLGKVGGAAGTQVASIGGLDASAYASPDRPVIPRLARRPAVPSRERMVEARPRRAPLVALLPPPCRSNGRRTARHGPASTPRLPGLMPRRGPHHPARPDRSRRPRRHRPLRRLRRLPPQPAFRRMWRPTWRQRSRLLPARR